MQSSILWIYLQFVLNFFLLCIRWGYGYFKRLLYWNVQPAPLEKVEIAFSANGGRTYKIRLPHSGKIKFLIATDYRGKDVTEELLPYLGPNYDFFGQKYTPGELGYTTLSLETDEGTYEYDRDQVLIVP